MADPRRIFRVEALEGSARGQRETVERAGSLLRASYWGLFLLALAGVLAAWSVRVDTRADGPAAVIDQGLVVALVPIAGGPVELGDTARLEGEPAVLQVVSVDTDPVAVRSTQRLLGLPPTTPMVGLVVVRVLPVQGSVTPGWRGRMSIQTGSERLLRVLVSGLVRLPPRS